MRGDRLLQAVDSDAVGGAVHVGGDDERPVESGSEPLRQEVVGLPGRQRARVVAGVGEGESHAEQRERQGDEHEHGQHAGDPRPPLHEAAPAVPEPVLGRGAAGLEQTRQVPLVDGVAGEAQHGGQQREGGDEHHEHGGDAGRGEADHVRLPYEVEPEERDHHRAAGEEDRPPRGHMRGDDGVAGSRPSKIPCR